MQKYRLWHGIHFRYYLIHSFCNSLNCFKTVTIMTFAKSHSEAFNGSRIITFASLPRCKRRGRNSCTYIAPGAHPHEVPHHSLDTLILSAEYPTSCSPPKTHFPRVPMIGSLYIFSIAHYMSHINAYKRILCGFGRFSSDLQSAILILSYIPEVERLWIGICWLMMW